MHTPPKSATSNIKRHSALDYVQSRKLKAMSRRRITIIQRNAIRSIKRLLALEHEPNRKLKTMCLDRVTINRKNVILITKQHSVLECDQRIKSEVTPLVRVVPPVAYNYSFLAILSTISHEVNQLSITSLVDKTLKVKTEVGCFKSRQFL